MLDPRFRTRGVAGDARRDRRAVRDPAPRHGARRAAVRSHHGAVVRRRSRRSASWRSCSAPQVLAAVNPWYALQLFGDASRAVAGHPRRGVPRGHRRRSAVCRHGPLRPAGPCGSRGWCWCGRRCVHQLFRPGRAAAAVRRRRSRILSTRSRRRRCCPRWCCCPPPRRSSPRRRRSPARSRSRARPCSSTCCRACACCRPRTVAHGQIYVPAANLFMFVAVVLFVVGVRQLERAVGGVRRLGGGHHADHHPARRAGREVAVELVVVARRRVVRPACCWSTSPSSPAT